MISVANVVIGLFTFNDVADKVDEIAAIISTQTVTANSTLGVSAGNAYVNGHLSANVLIATQALRGGNNSTNAAVSIPNGFTYGNTNYYSASYACSNADQQQLDSFLIASYRSAEYAITVKTANSYQMSKFLVIHDGSNSFMTEYAIVASNGGLATFTSTLNSTAVKVMFTPGDASTNLVFTRHASQV